MTALRCTPLRLGWLLRPQPQIQRHVGEGAQDFDQSARRGEDAGGAYPNIQHMVTIKKQINESSPKMRLTLAMSIQDCNFIDVSSTKHYNFSPIQARLPPIVKNVKNCSPT